MTERKKSSLDIATDLLARHVPALLAVFAKLRGAKKAPQSMRSLQPLAFVFFLEAFGLAHLLTEEDRAAAWGAARGPGRNGDDYDPTDDTDETRALRWVAARRRALDEAYRDHVRAVADQRGLLPPHLTAHEKRSRLADFMASIAAPDRAEFERQWGERNPIDPATAPACFDPRAQLSILDAVSPERDGIIGVFLAETRLRAEEQPIIEHAGQKLDLTGCATLSEAAWRAACERWIIYLDHRGATVGLRFLPPLDGIRTRLRAPLVNIVAADVEPAPSAHVEAPPPAPPGEFVSLIRLRSGTVSLEADGRKISLHGCRVPTTAAARAIDGGWSCTPTIRDGLQGLLFAPSASAAEWLDTMNRFEPTFDAVPEELDADGFPPNASEAVRDFADLGNGATTFNTMADDIVSPVPLASSGVSGAEAARSFQAASAATFARVEIDDEPAQLPKPKDAQPSKKPSGVEGKIKKNGKRAAS